MNPQDAICAADLDRGEPEPQDVCVDCGVEIPIGLLRCQLCDDAHAAKEQFELHAADPRRW